MAPVHSVLKRGVVYGLANNDGSSSIDVPVGTSPAIQAVQTKLLQKVSITPEVLRRDAGTPSALLQRVQVQDSSPIYYTAYRLEGEEPSIAYTQRGIHSDHNGITFLCSQIFAPGHHELDAHFDLPGSSAVGVFPYLQVSVLSEFLSSFSRGGNATSQSTVSFHITTDVEPDGTGTEQISLNGAGDIYVGPLRRIVPWLSSFQSGLHHARVVIDGETTVDEDFIQRGLMFKDPLPTIGTGQPADIPVRTTFGWTNDDTVIDESLPVYLPRWRAALDGSSPTPWRSDNQVDFTINNLRETLTKNIEPLTTSPVRFQSLTKTYQSNKQLDYVVQARAFGLQREYQISSNGSVPGFRRNLILSNFQQTPPQFSNGSQVVFEADINLINFENAVPDTVIFHMGYDQTTGEYAFQSAGELTPTDYGWHLSVPWTATELPSNGGYLEVAFRENDDYRKSASDNLEFTVQPAPRNLQITNETPVPNKFNPVDGEHFAVEFDVLYTGSIAPGAELNTQVDIVQEGTVLRQFKSRSPATPQVHIVAPADRWDGKIGDKTISGPFQCLIYANTTVLVAGGTGAVEEALPKSVGATAASNQLVNAELTILDTQQNPVAKGYSNPSTNQVIDRNKLLRTVQSEFDPEFWSIKVDNLNFADSPPASINATASSSASNVVVNVELTRSGNSYVSNQLGTYFPRNQPRQFVNYSDHTKSDVQQTYCALEADFAREYDLGQDLASKALIPGSPPFPRVVSQPLGIFREKFSALADNFPGLNLKLEAPTTIPGPKPYLNNFPSGGYEILKVEIKDPAAKLREPLYASVKLRHSADIVCANLHGFHWGELQLDNNTLFLPFQGLSQIPTTWLFMSCSILDFRDFNGFFNSNHFPKTAIPNAGYDPGGGLTYQEVVQGTTLVHKREFGGPLWMSGIGGGSPSAAVSSLKTPVLLGYNAPAPTVSLQAVNTEFAKQLKSSPAVPAGHDPRIFAWLRANRVVAQKSGTSVGWLCLNACAWDKLKGQYYYIPYRPPHGVYGPDAINVHVPHARVKLDANDKDPAALSEFGIWSIPLASTSAPEIDKSGSWSIPPKDLGSELEGESKQ